MLYIDMYMDQETKRCTRKERKLFCPIVSPTDYMDQETRRCLAKETRKERKLFYPNLAPCKLHNYNDSLPYSLAKIQSFDVSLSGGTTLYQITRHSDFPFHCFSHYDRQGYEEKEFKTADSWGTIFERIDKWGDPLWKNIYNRDIIQAIYKYDGNGITAYVEDETGIYLVRGAWG